MERVAYCALPPGEAIKGGGSADVIDTGLDFDYFVGRLYIGQLHAEEIGAAAGLVTPIAHEATVEAVEQLEGELVAARAEVAALKSALEEAESLRQAIAYTLERGVVIDQKKGTVGLRHKPGQTRIDLSRSLWQSYVEDVETAPAEPAAA